MLRVDVTKPAQPMIVMDGDGRSTLLTRVRDAWGPEDGFLRIVDEAHMASGEGRVPIDTDLIDDFAELLQPVAPQESSRLRKLEEEQPHRVRPRTQVEGQDTTAKGGFYAIERTDAELLALLEQAHKAVRSGSEDADRAQNAMDFWDWLTGVSDELEYEALVEQTEPLIEDKEEKASELDPGAELEAAKARAEAAEAELARRTEEEAEGAIEPPQPADVADDGGADAEATDESEAQAAHADSLERELKDGAE